MIEAITYRHGGHSRADPGTYRPDEEVRQWLARDPIPMYRTRLAGAGASEEQLGGIEHSVEAWIEAAVEEAKAAPEPSVDSIATEVWADGGSRWRN